LVVNEARPMEPRPPRTGGFGGGNDGFRSPYGGGGRREGGGGESGFRSPYGSGPRGGGGGNGGGGRREGGGGY
jgi:cold-inducible RNA-binding protein